MHILIQKDAATRVPKECTEEEAAAFANEFDVFVVGEDGGVSPYQAPAAEVVEEVPAAKPAKTKAK